MKRSRKPTIQIVAGVVIAVFIASTWLKSRQIDLGWLKYFSIAVFIAGLIFTLWDAIFWRNPLIQRLPGVPRNIRGTWKGELASFWVEPTSGKRIAPKAAYLVVRQTAGSVSVALLTDESRSSSSLAEVRDIDGVPVLAYMYLNKPEMSFEHRSRMHHGSSVLEVFGFPANRIEGRYWTDRDTRGELNFNEHSGKIAGSYEEAASLFG